MRHLEQGRRKRYGRYGFGRTTFWNRNYALAKRTRLRIFGNFRSYTVYWTLLTATVDCSMYLLASLNKPYNSFMWIWLNTIKLINHTLVNKY